MAAVVSLKDLPPTPPRRISETILAPCWRWSSAGGYCSPQTVKRALAAFPPQQPLRLAARRLFQETSFQFPNWPRWVLLVPLEGVFGAAGGQGTPGASRIPQWRARTGSSKLRCCRRNPRNRHFRGGRSPCRDMPAVPRGCCALCQEGGGGTGHVGGCPGVGGPSLAAGALQGLAARRQQPGAAGPRQLRCFVAPRPKNSWQGREAAGQARPSPRERGWKLRQAAHALATSRDPWSLPRWQRHSHHSDAGRENVPHLPEQGASQAPHRGAPPASIQAARPLLRRPAEHRRVLPSGTSPSRAPVPSRSCRAGPRG